MEKTMDNDLDDSRSRAKRMSIEMGGKSITYSEIISSHLARQRTNLNREPNGRSQDHMHIPSFSKGFANSHSFQS